MKKLLGIVGTIITAGSGMSGIVANASASAKNEINYLQTSNLETLKRNKRQNNKIYEKEVKLKNLKEIEIENIQQNSDELKLIIKIPIIINKKNIEEVLKERPKPIHDKLEFILPTFSKKNDWIGNTF